MQKGKYCLDVSARALVVYEKFFDIEFPLPKLDTLAVPEGGSGAMENWVGLFLHPIIQRGRSSDFVVCSGPDSEWVRNCAFG